MASPRATRQGVRRCLFAVVTTLLVASFGCESHDIGKPCPDLLGDEAAGNSGETRLETQEVVAQNASFPCDELICIATDGRPGYCSKRCREDAGCPSGFECRVIQEIGEFAGQGFCAWKVCEKRTDCGKKQDFCCVPAPQSVAGEPYSLCEFKGEVTCRERIAASQ